MNINNKYTCPMCKTELKLLPKHLSRVKEMISGMRYQRTVFDCPYCDNNTTVQVDNDQSLKLARDALRLELKQLKGQTLHPKQRSKLSRLNHELEDRRAELMRFWLNNCTHEVQETVD